MDNSIVKKYGFSFVSCLVAFVCGALFINYLNGGKATFDELKVGKLIFDEAQIDVPAKGGKTEVACRIDKSGAVFAGGVSAGEIHSVATVTGRFYLSSTPVGMKLADSKIYGEMAITDESGAIFILRNANGVNIPSQGGSKNGNALFMGFEVNDAPSIFQQTISEDKDKLSKNYLMRPLMDSERKAREITASESDQEKPDVK